MYTIVHIPEIHNIGCGILNDGWKVLKKVCYSWEEKSRKAPENDEYEEHSSQV